MINKLISFIRDKIQCDIITPALDSDVMQQIEDLQQQLAELRYDSLVEINVKVAQLEIVMDNKLHNVAKSLDTRIKKLERGDRRIRTQELLLNRIIGDGDEPNPSAYLKH